MKPVDINDLLKILSTMDKKDIEEGLAKAQKFLDNQNMSNTDISKEK